MGLISARRSRDESGAAGVEFMIVALVLIVLMLLALSYGYLATLRHTLAQAASEGVRAAAVSPESEPMSRDAAALAAVNETLGESTLEISCTGTAPGSDLVRDEVVVGECSVTTAACPEDLSSECATVSFDYDYVDHPVGPAVPGRGLFLPDHVHEARTTPVS